MKNFTISCIIIGLFCLYACKKLTDIPSVLAPHVETMELEDVSNLQEITVMGKVAELGDGIIQHGHVWSTEATPTTDDLKTTLGALSDTTTFSSLLHSIDPNTNYFIRAYLEDTYGRTFYSEKIVSLQPEDPIDVIASFTFSPTTCPAPCTIVFTNTSENADIYKWYVDDIERSSNINFTETFMEAGVFSIKLEAFSANNADMDSNSKNVTIEESITFEETEPGYGPGKRVIETEEGYAILSSKNNEISFVRIDKEGDFIASQEYPPLNSGTIDIAQDMIQLSSGNFVIVGVTTNPISNDNDIYYLRIDPSGMPLTGPKREEGSAENENVKKVIETNDGRVLVVGARNTHSFIIKKDVNFTTHFIPLSNTSFLVDNLNIVSTCIEMVNGELLFLGEVEIGGQFEGFSIKTDEMGNPISQDLILFPNPTSERISIKSVSYSPISNTFLAAGSTIDNLGNSSCYVLELDEDGIPTASFPPNIGSPTSNETCKSICVLEDGTMVLVGTKDSDPFIQKLFANGEIDWTQDDFEGNTFNHIQKTQDGGFITVGSKLGTLFIVKTNTLGEQ